MGKEIRPLVRDSGPRRVLNLWMMTVHKVAGIDGPGYADYLTSKGGEARRGDYYLGRGGHARENPGAWHGRGAEEIGLSGTVPPGGLPPPWGGRAPPTPPPLVAPRSPADHPPGAAAPPPPPTPP